MKPWMLIAVVLFAGCAKPAASDDAQSSAPAASKEATYEPQVGDVVFQSLPHGTLVNTIEGATQSPLSHCGLVAHGPKGWVVVEANGSVKETKFDRWIAQGRGGNFSAYRFAEKYADKIPQMVAAARKRLGKPYDLRYEFDDRALYCSELVFKAFQEATGEECGRVVTLGELNWQPYEKFIRFLDGGGLPLERRMITPKHLSEAEQLTPVFRKGL
ncbi:MAG: YiiX/YebB-like N1pC/P60 family cysteine hydrolase [Pirellulales bacterium]